MATPFLTSDFLLDTGIARRLYREVAADLPIIDYHSHLPPTEIAERRRFRNIAELWLGGDHYKWRLMRVCGVSEDFITGSRTDEEKFKAFCRVLPLAAGHPVYQWSHLELRRLFGINHVINADNAGAIWAEANDALASIDCWDLLASAKVEVACTTDDPIDDLHQHQAISRSSLKTRVLPAYRPDKAMRINAPDFADYLAQLARASGTEITSFASLVSALSARMDFFHGLGARVSDHALDTALPATPVAPDHLEKLFAKRLRGTPLSEGETGDYVAGLLHHLGEGYAKRGWVMCLHMGARRNNNSRTMDALGPDTGYDSISDTDFAGGVAVLLDGLEAAGSLPKTLLFCLNPSMNEVLSTLSGCFHEAGVLGKVQFGPAWWFNDHKDGNLQQLRTLANHGVLGTSVGMVTDSRSFASYPRHDYFRRLLCRLLGEWVEAGEYPDDFKALADIVHGVSYANAKNYFRF
jgi:glucuronate isomerase